MNVRPTPEQKPVASDPDSMGFAPTLRIKTDKMEIPGTEIQKTRKGVGCSVIAVMCVSLASGGSVATLGYQYINKKFPFAPESSASVAPTDSNEIPTGDTSGDAPDNADLPEMISSNEDLSRALKKHQIRATDQDFDFETARPELQAKAVYLMPPKNADAAPENINNWRPVRERISRINQNETLVAVKIINPNLGRDAHKLIVAEGLSYRARTTDATDPSIIYFYYNCQDKKGEASLLAQIGIKDPVRPRKLMWAKSFMLPVCE